MNGHKSLTKQQQRSVLLVIFLPLFVAVIGLACDIPVGSWGATEQEREYPTAEATQRPGEKSADTAGETALVELTDTPSPTPSATFTVTPTPTPWVNITGNTNCRFGPGNVYDLIHTYLAGDQALLLGKDAGENFWYIKHPGGASPDCWLWGKYATPVGDTAGVPVFTPPPTPTPYLNFSIAYAGSDCGAGSCWLWFQIDSTGTVALESVKTYAKNTSTSNDATNQANIFKTGIMGSDIAKINPGGAGYTHSGQLNNPSGATVKVTITVCSQDGMGGICLTRNLSITP